MMKKQNHTRRLVPAALLLILVLICGSVFAYMFRRTESLGGQFIPAQVSCLVHDEGTTTQITGVTLENTGNIKEYLRVRLVTYWVDGDGNVAPLDSPSLDMTGLYDDANWVKSSSSNTFYFKDPVVPDAPDDFTLDLLIAPIPLAQDPITGYKQAVDIFGEAIQAEPTTAVTESWHVTLTGTAISTAP